MSGNSASSSARPTMSARGRFALRTVWLFASLVTPVVGATFGACGTSDGATASAPSTSSAIPACDGTLPVPDDSVVPMQRIGACKGGACATAADCLMPLSTCDRGKSFQAHSADLTWSFSDPQCQAGACIYRTTFHACIYDSCEACGAGTCVFGGPSPYCGNADHSCAGPCGAPCFAGGGQGQCIDGTCHLGGTTKCPDGGSTDASADAGDASSDIADATMDDAGDADAGDAAEEG